jgi:putative FmdB family regulatory protein
MRCINFRLVSFYFCVNSRIDVYKSKIYPSLQQATDARDSGCMRLWSISFVIGHVEIGSNTLIMADCRPHAGQAGIFMPIYEFECSACGHRFDRLQKLSDEDPTICPSCGVPQLKRRVSAPSFRLAGSGWYETDFKKDGDKKRNLAEGKTDESAPKSDTPDKTAPAPATTPAAAPTPAPAPASSTPSTSKD